MRIAVNALFLRSGRVGGSEIALRGLVNALARRRPEDRIRVYLPEAEAALGLFDDSIIEVAAPLPARPRALRIAGEQTWLPARVALDGSEVLWNAGFTAPLLTSIPQATTVFDTQHLRHPEYFRATHRVAWRVLVDAALARSGRIVCPSVATRVDLETLRPRHSRKYRHVPLGVEDEWLRDRGADDAATWRHRFGLPERFAVCLATTHPHKGHDTLLRAWRSMLDAGAAPPPLVLTGVSGFADRAIHESARQLRVDSHVRHLGWIAREDLRMLLSSATVALLPSRFEGFGLPLLEAMALGTPAVANDLPVFREVGGDLVHLVAATDGAAWAEAIRAVLALPDGVRREWAVRSRRAAAAWTWDRAASALRAVLAETLTAGRSVDGMETREV